MGDTRRRPRLTPFPSRGFAIARPREKLVETRFQLYRERVGWTGRGASSAGRHGPRELASWLPTADEVSKAPQ